MAIEVVKGLESENSTILIIDGSPDDRDIYRQFLLGDKGHTYEVLEAETGEAGLNKIRTNQCHLILLDFNLPDLDGLEFLEMIQQENFQIPVVVMTGTGNEAIAVQSMKQGALDYLVKGQITPESLQSTVRNVLEQVRLQSQLQQSIDRQNSIISIALRIRQSLDLKKVLEEATSEIHRLLVCDRVLIYQFADDMSGLIVAESLNPQYKLSFGQQIIDTCFQNGGDRNYLQGRHSVIDDVYKAGLKPCHLRLLEQFQVKANLVLPILPTVTDDGSGQGQSPKLWGLLIAHQCDQPRHWTKEESELMQSLSIQLAIAIQQAELLARTQQSLQLEQELNALKSQIIGTVSHEYRSPLTSILAAASTLKRHGPNLTDANQDKLLGMIETKVRHMNRLIEKMLFLNQVERGKVPIKSESVNLADFLVEKVEEHRLESPDYTIHVETRGDVGAVENAPIILSQILDNVLSNAIKYSSDRHDIDIELKGLVSQVIVTIKDYGIGISRDELKKIFQPFYRGMNVGTISGTGLGLSIVQGCLEMCGGKISYNSEPNRGTTVTLGFPRKIDCQLSSAEECI